MVEGGRSKERQDDRVRLLFRRVRLWNKKSAHEEWVRRQFHNPCFAGMIRSGYFQARANQPLLVCRIQAKIAVVFFGDLDISIYAGGLRSRLHAHFHSSSNERTTQRSNKQAGCVRVSLRVCGLANSHHISRIFKYKMLRTSARAEKWNLLLACVLNTVQRAWKEPAAGYARIVPSPTTTASPPT
jgi:hypothetical protein